MASSAPKCKFGARCYRRKYKKHMEQFSHDGIVFPDDLGSVDNSSDQAKGDAGTTDEQQPVKRAKVDIPDDILKKDIEAKFLVAFPAEFFRFWKDVQTIANGNSAEDICKALSSVKNLRLVGVFDYIAGNVDEVADSEVNFYLTKDRFSTDLPQMQTIAVYDEGRFAFWRDKPDQEDALLVHVKNTDEHFPKVEIIGCRDPTHMLAFLKKVYHEELSSADDILAKLAHSDAVTVNNSEETNNAKYDAEDFLENYKTMVVELEKKRHELANGNPSHGLGIVIGDDYIYHRGRDELKPMLDEIVKEKEPTLKRALNMGFLLDMVDCCKEHLTREENVGMSLEYGQELFMSNYEEFNDMAMTLLHEVYGVLKFHNFQRILSAHMEVRREPQHIEQ